MSKKILLLALIIACFVVVGAGCKEKPPIKPVSTPSPAPILTTRCENLLSNVVVPLKDMETFEDQEYTAVTITERAAWDQEKLPAQVLNLETQGYNCNPLPLEFKEDKAVPGMNIEPQVTKVQWDCELPYAEYDYLEESDLETKNSLEEAGFVCEQEECVNDQGNSSVWFCSK